ncbi:hypothetical protein C8J56DRAFT_925051 [Mycena floridula]|nr:hypothetical protein C8J56DRAFT_925051 [Mycena floridula]
MNGYGRLAHYSSNFVQISPTSEELFFPSFLPSKISKTEVIFISLIPRDIKATVPCCIGIRRYRRRASLDSPYLASSACLFCLLISRTNQAEYANKMIMITAPAVVPILVRMVETPCSDAQAKMVMARYKDNMEPIAKRLGIDKRNTMCIGREARSMISSPGASANINDKAVPKTMETMLAHREAKAATHAALGIFERIIDVVAERTNPLVMPKVPHRLINPSLKAFHSVGSAASSCACNRFGRKPRTTSIIMVTKVPTSPDSDTILWCCVDTEDPKEG